MVGKKKRIPDDYYRNTRLGKCYDGLRRLFSENFRIPGLYYRKQGEDFRVYQFSRRRGRERGFESGGKGKAYYRDFLGGLEPLLSGEFSVEGRETFHFLSSRAGRRGRGDFQIDDVFFAYGISRFFENFLHDRTYRGHSGIHETGDVFENVAAHRNAVLPNEERFAVFRDRQCRDNAGIVVTGENFVVDGFLSDGLGAIGEERNVVPSGENSTFAEFEGVSRGRDEGGGSVHIRFG